MNKKIISKISIINFLLLLFLITNAYSMTEECYENVLDNYDDEMKNDCMDEYGYDYLDNCMEEFGDDYAEECIENARETGDFEFAQDDDACIEEYKGFFAPFCINDHENEDVFRDLCFDDHIDEFVDIYLENHESDLHNIDGCCYDNSYWSSNDEECVESSRFDCLLAGGECDSSEEVDCFSSSGHWFDNSCIENDEEFNCLSDGYNYLDDFCYDNYAEYDCILNDGYWNPGSDECIQSSNEFDCVYNGENWLEVEGLCIGSDDKFSCIDDGKFFSDNTNTCYENEDEFDCAEDGGYFYDGECISNQEKFNCLSGAGTWEDDRCLDSQTEAQCRSNGYLWSEDNTKCYENDEEFECINENYHWYNDKCYENEDEFDCVSNGKFFNEDTCYDLEDSAQCEASGNFWFNDINKCLESEDEYNCLKDNNNYFDGFCYEDNKEYDCVSQGNFFSTNDNKCYENEDKYNCLTNGEFYYNGKCVPTEEEYTCISNGGFYSDSDGICSDLEEMNLCRNNNMFWSEVKGLCYEEEWIEECYSQDSFPVKEDNTCVDNEEKANCLNNHMNWLEDDNSCYNDDVYDCKSSGNLWSNSLSQCFENKNSMLCAEADNIWVEDLNTCFENYDQAECLSDGYIWYEGNCYESEDKLNCIKNSKFFSDETNLCYDTEAPLECEENGNYFSDDQYKCYGSEEIASCSDNNEFYCSNTDSCVASENACCDEDGLYVEFEGVCADSVDEAECLDEGSYFSDFLDECFDDEDQLECDENGNFWSNSLTECFESQEEKSCLERESIYVGGVCLLDYKNDEEERNNWENKKVELENEKEYKQNNEGRDSNSIIDYASRNGDYFKLKFVSNNRISSENSYIKALYGEKLMPGLTSAKFNPDGKYFIFGDYGISLSTNSITKTSYSISSTYDKDLKRNIKVKNLFGFDYDLLLDWNKNDNTLYFLDMKKENNKGILEYSGNYNFNIRSFNTKNIEKEFNNVKNPNTKYSIEDLNKKISVITDLYDLSEGERYEELLTNVKKIKNNNLFQLNPVSSDMGIIGIERKTRNNKNQEKKLLIANFGNDEISYSNISSLFANPNDMEDENDDTDFFKFSNNGKYVLTYEKDNKYNRFYIYSIDDLYSEKMSNTFKIFNGIILENELSFKKVTSFAFDSNYINNSDMPKGIFYSIKNTNTNKITIYYLDIEDENFFEVYSFIPNYNSIIDDIAVNPTKDELIYHYCKIDSLICDLDYLKFERPYEYELVMINSSINFNYSLIENNSFINLTQKEQFLKDWNENPILYVGVYDEFGLTTEFYINLSDGVVYDGYIENYDAELTISEKILNKLLDKSNNQLNEYFIEQLLNTNEIRYKVVEEKKPLTQKVKYFFMDFFSGFFGKLIKNDLQNNSIINNSCEEDWSCNNWVECSDDGTQTRICSDKNNCGTSKLKPNLEQSCLIKDVQVINETINSSCGNNVCETGENCLSCSRDCNVCEFDGCKAIEYDCEDNKTCTICDLDCEECTN